MKERFIKELETTKRVGIDGLLQEMEDGGFFTAPCSGAHHLAEPEGLLKHSLNVLDYARKLNISLDANINDDSIIITALLHDLGKMGDFGKPNYTENYLKGGELSKAKPYTTNTNLLYLPHEVRSVSIARRYIDLSEEEEFAIITHNGLYGDFRYVISGKETPLYMILHFADMWCSRVVEIEKEEG